MKPNIRKFALATHIISSVGWLGAVVAFLIIAVASPKSSEAQIIYGLYLALWMIGWYIIVPFCLASLFTGLVMSLSTKWGLLRHYWVTIKFLLTVVSTLILFGFTRTLNYLDFSSEELKTSTHDLHNLPQSPIIHSAGGLLVLLATTFLSVYKPWGMTLYGRRQNESQLIENRPPLISAAEETKALTRVTSTTPRWMLIVGIFTIALALIFLVIHIIGINMRSH